MEYLLYRSPAAERADIYALPVGITIFGYYHNSVLVRFGIHVLLIPLRACIVIPYSGICSVALSCITLLGFYCYLLFKFFLLSDSSSFILININ